MIICTNFLNKKFKVKKVKQITIWKNFILKFRRMRNMLPNYDLVPHAKNSRKHFSSHVVVEQKKINLLTQKSFQRGKPQSPPLPRNLPPYKTRVATAGASSAPPHSTATRLQQTRQTPAAAAPAQVTQPRENRGVAGRALLAWAGGR